MKSLLKYVTLVLLFSQILTLRVVLSESEKIPFDMYGYEITWVTKSPNHPEIKNSFTIHGLWPNKLDGSPVPICDPKAPNKLNISTQTRKEMNSCWISIQDNWTDEKFYEHELKQHGRCYTYHKNKSQDEYFGKTLALFKEYKMKDLLKEILAGKIGDIKISFNNLIQHLKKLFNIYFDVKCEHGNILRAIRFYFKLDFTPLPESELKHFSQKTNCRTNQDIIIQQS
jgi:ribonuclease I